MALAYKIRWITSSLILAITLQITAVANLRFAGGPKPKGLSEYNDNEANQSAYSGDCFGKKRIAMTVI